MSSIPPIVAMILAFELFVLLHVLAMALAARGLGIGIEAVQFGMDPRIAKLGLFQLGALPIGGFVRMKDSRAEQLDASQLHEAFNHQPPWKQVLMPLSAPAALLALCMVPLGPADFDSFVAAFGQIASGALHPLSAAQGYLSAFTAYAKVHPPAAVFALVGVKLVAYNLLPLSLLNGGHALLNLLRWRRHELSWQSTADQWSLMVVLAISISWLVALGSWAWRGG